VTPTNTPTPTATPVCSVAYNASKENTMVSLVNQIRAENGLAAYSVDSRLVAAARVYSVDMACNGARDHIGSDGSTSRDRVAAQGYSYTWVGENYYIGWGSWGTPEKAFDWWIHSEPHLNNILHTRYTEFGVGYVYYDNRHYWTIDFARP
jgi:uncharacterized protein YkwD